MDCVLRNFVSGMDSREQPKVMVPRLPWHWPFHTESCSPRCPKSLDPQQVWMNQSKYGHQLFEQFEHCIFFAINGCFLARMGLQAADWNIHKFLCVLLEMQKVNCVHYVMQFLTRIGFAFWVSVSLVKLFHNLYPFSCQSWLNSFRGCWTAVDRKKMKTVVTQIENITIHNRLISFAGSKGTMTTSAEAGDLIPFDTWSIFQMWVGSTQKIEIDTECSYSVPCHSMQCRMMLVFLNFNAPNFLQTLTPRCHLGWVWHSGWAFHNQNAQWGRHGLLESCEAKAAWRMEFEADAVAAQSECRFLQADEIGRFLTSQTVKAALLGYSLMFS